MKGVLKQGTLKNYFTTKKYVKLFLAKRFKTDDIYLSELNYQFITEFEFFLRSTKPLEESNPLGNNGIMKHIERLKKVARLGVMMEWIPKHPFERFKLRFQKTEREILTKQELALIENFSFSKANLNRVKDLFKFGCYTGLAYIDLINLTPYNICIGMDGEYWIKTFRQKTEVPVKGIMLCGYSSSEKSGEKTETNRGLTDFWIVKLDKHGKIEWNKTVGGNKFEFCGGLELTDDGGLILCGNSASDSCRQFPYYTSHIILLQYPVFYRLEYQWGSDCG
jgi:Phage integrase SAM-like domain